MHAIQKTIQTWLNTQNHKHIFIAYSGGIDSHVLLHALSQTTDQTITAIHINHQIHPNSNAWAHHCKQICDTLNIKIKIIQLDPLHTTSNLEANARQHRYQALYHAAGANQHLLLAHHQQDQAETVLFRLFRGSGIRGLQGMQIKSCYKDLVLHRPLLNTDPKDILNYSKVNHLNYLQDPSNDSLVHDRNYIRHQILPLIYDRWPSANKQIASCSEHLSSIENWLGDQIPHEKNNEPLDTSQLNTSNNPLFHSQIQHWLSAHQLMIPSKIWLQQLNNTVINARCDRQPQLKIGHYFIRRYQNKLYIDKKSEFIVPHTKVDYSNYTDFSIVLKTKKGFGIASKHLNKLTIKFRQGNERFKQNDHTPSKTLKNCFQSLSIPPWIRYKIPLVFSGDRLVAIGNYAVSDEFSCTANEDGYYFETY